MPKPTPLHIQIHFIVDLVYGSNYAAGKAIAEATGEPLKTAIARVDRLTSPNPPEYLLKLEQMLDALGYHIEITRKPECLSSKKAKKSKTRPE
jgi:hypothetical protein